MNIEAKQPTTAKEIFVAACRLSSPGERAQFLQEVCHSDADLRRRIEEMLASEDSSRTSPLDRMGAMLNPTALEVDSALGQIPLVDIANHPLIGPYKLLEQIGEGGMGTVFMAVQSQPIKRKVALKIIKPGMDTGQVIARFEVERQALAMMNHPNIAKVLDAGATETGSPYFVMELVRGIPITEFCDLHKLDLRQRLEMFSTVCQAVQHAHQKGVIHRDLKPSNILVELQDATPVPKVIDFGVAKPINQPLTERTLHTGFSQMIGTPLYMSPEQTQLSSLDVDTRSDVYSLGVLLYEMLTGSTPFDRETLKQAGFDEMRRIIREDEPQKPSERISTLAVASLATISDQRKVDPRRLNDSLGGELDWIVMKALEKDRARRYESASAFAQDIQRYLNDEPVQACPPTLSYHIRKYLKRHRTNMSWGLAGVVVLAVCGTLLGYSSYQEGARNDKVRERVELALREVETAIAAGDLALAQKPMAEAAALVSQNQLSASAFAARVDELSVELKDRRNDQVRYEGLLASARDAQDRMTFSKELSGDKAAEGTLSPFGVLDQDAWLQNLESSSLSVAQKSRARETIYETLLCLADHGPRWVRTDESARKSLELLQRAEQFHTPTKAFYWVGSECYRVLQETDACDQALVQYNATPATIALDYYLPGHTAGWRGDRKAAMQAYRAALRIQSDHYNSLFFLADRLAADKHFDEAIAYYTGCIALRPSHVFAFVNRAEAYEKSGDKDSAELDFRTATEVSAIPNHHIGAFNELLEFYRRTGQHENHREALAQLTSESERIIAEQSTNASPDNLHTYELLTQLGQTLCRAGDLDDGIPLLEQALSCARRHFGNVHEKTLISMNALSNILTNSNRAAESVPLLKEELAVSRQLNGVEHKDTLIVTENLGWAYLGAAQFMDGADLFQKLLETQTRLLGPEHPDTLASMNNLATAYNDANQGEQAAATLKEFAAGIRKGPKRDDPQFAGQLANASLELLRCGQHVIAEELLRECLAIREKTQPDVWSTFNTKSMLGAALLGQKKYAEAEPLLLAGYEGMKQREKTIPEQGKIRFRQAIERLVQLYTDWHAAEQDKGYDAKATDWQKKLNDFKAAANAEPSPTTDKATVNAK